MPFKDPEKRKAWARENSKKQRDKARGGPPRGEVSKIVIPDPEPGSIYHGAEGESAEPPASTVEITKPPKRGIFGPSKPRSAKSPGAPRGKVADITAGLESLVKFGGAFVEEKGDPGVGRSIVFTAPTSAKLLGKTVERFPALHAFLAIFLGAGTGMVEAQAAFGIPIVIGRMERHPETIPGSLPVLKSYMRPVLNDMLIAAKDEKKVRDELVRLEAELGETTGIANYSVDKMILCELLGLSEAIAEGIITKQISGADLARMDREATAAREATAPDGEDIP